MGNIQIKAAAVLQLLDLYTQKTVNLKYVRVIIKQQCKIIMKEEGFIVILESPGVKQLDIQIESGIYQTKQLTVKLEKETLKEVYPVWLQTKKGYPFSAGTTFIKGISLAGDFMLSWKNKEKPIRLLVDYQEGSDTIQMINAGEFVAERYYGIWQKDEGEVFKLRGAEEELKQGYKLEKPCKNSYKRGESVVVQLLPVEVIDKEFYIGIPDIPKDGTVCKVYRNNICMKEIQIEYGKENILDV